MQSYFLCVIIYECLKAHVRTGYLSCTCISTNLIRTGIEVVITALTRNQVILHGTEGSNPSLSAIRMSHPMGGFFICMADREAYESLSRRTAQGSHLNRKPSGSLLTSGSAKNPRFSEYPSFFFSCICYDDEPLACEIVLYSFPARLITVFPALIAFLTKLAAPPHVWVTYATT